MPRGAAALGRLQLRLGDAAAAGTPKQAAPTDITAAPTVTGGINLGDAGNIGGDGVQRYSTVVNPNLRLS